MTAERAPRLVVVVDNGITGDSRVQKTALAAARAGWDVTLLGQSRRGRQESWIGPVRVLRVPLRRELHDRFERAWRRDHAPAAAAVPVPTGAAARAERFARRAVRAVARRLPDPVARRLVAARTTRTTRTTRTAAVPAVAPAGPAAPAVSTAKALPEVAAAQVRWRRDWPVLVDWQLTFRPEIVALEPDVVHANDVTMLGVVARAAAELRLAGKPVGWLYDAHEYVPAVDWGGEAVSAAYRQYESEYVGRADAVVTVSTGIAAQLQDEHGLERTPAVVANVPVRGVVGSGPTARDLVGVGPQVPLLVYSGYLAPERGLDVAVDALAQLPDVHLVVVTSAGLALDALVAQAEALDVAGRLHHLPYVPPTAVPHLLSGADLGLVASLHSPNYEESLPTKLAEYLHARLPLVVSDLRTVGAFVEEHGLGEVFTAGDATALAHAVRRALSRRDELRSSITEELLELMSWEKQVEVLHETYRQVAPVPLPDPPADPVPWDVDEVPDPPAGRR